MSDNTLLVITSTLSIIAAIAPLYLKVGRLEGRLDILHEKVTSLCTRLNSRSSSSRKE